MDIAVLIAAVEGASSARWTTLSIITHEPATNAVKYGALAASHGSLAVTWRLAPGGGVELAWEEAASPPRFESAPNGFGTSLIDNAVRQIGGQILREWRAEGLRRRISSPDDRNEAPETLLVQPALS